MSCIESVCLYRVIIVCRYFDQILSVTLHDVNVVKWRQEDAELFNKVTVNKPHLQLKVKWILVYILKIVQSYAFLFDTFSTESETK